MWKIKSLFPLSKEPKIRTLSEFPRRSQEGFSSQYEKFILGDLLESSIGNNDNFFKIVTLFCVNVTSSLGALFKEEEMELRSHEIWA